MTDQAACLSALADERTVSLATRRRDGREVRTPVWVVRDPGSPSRLLVYTNARSGKVKRIRHTPRVCLAACDARGRLANDARWSNAIAKISDDRACEARCFEQLADKYGWQARLLFLAARLGGRWKDRCVLELVGEET